MLCLPKLPTRRGSQEVLNMSIPITLPLQKDGELLLKASYWVWHMHQKNKLKLPPLRRAYWPNNTVPFRDFYCQRRNDKESLAVLFISKSSALSYRVIKMPFKPKTITLLKFYLIVKNGDIHRVALISEAPVIKHHTTDNLNWRSGASGESTHTYIYVS